MVLLYIIVFQTLLHQANYCKLIYLCVTEDEGVGSLYLPPLLGLFQLISASSVSILSVVDRDSTPNPWKTTVTHTEVPGRLKLQFHFLLFSSSTRRVNFR